MTQKAQPAPSDWGPPRRVFGLGIDEKVCWIISDVNNPWVNDADVEYLTGSFDAIDIKNSSHKPLELQSSIRSELESFCHDNPSLFETVEGIGVSTIGVVDGNRLRSVARKNFLPNSKCKNKEEAFLIDFPTIFEGLFKKSSIDKIEVYNDATAKALVEYHVSDAFKTDDMSSILYLMFDEGVNGGIIYNDRELSSLLHPEMGHIRPRRHPKDYFSAGNICCPAHSDCFEALCSGARIREQWKKTSHPENFNIGDLDDQSEAWEIISEYVAQLCMIGTLLLSPKRIILAGSVITGRENDQTSYYRTTEKLFPSIRTCFDNLNNGYLYYDAMKDRDFISTARVVNDVNALAALQIAQISAYCKEIAGRPIKQWGVRGIIPGGRSGDRGIWGQ